MSVQSRSVRRVGIATDNSRTIDGSIMISLRPPKRVLSSGVRALDPQSNARIDGGDVNLVTTSASGELPNHPEAQIKLPWVGESKTSFL